MIAQRPELHKDLDADLFLEYYYLKEEMRNFCREHGLATSGGKNEIKIRVERFLRTGEMTEDKRMKASKTKRRQQAIPSLASEIEEDICCTELHRKFFESVIGKQFHFTVKFQRYLKENAGTTYAQAVEVWYQLAKERKEHKGLETIDPQFEYNRYIRAFFAGNPDRTLKDAIACWKYKRSLPGSNAYEKEDLTILNSK